MDVAVAEHLAAAADDAGAESPAAGEHRCHRGWLDRDAARPCPTCRPWLARRPARPPTRAQLKAYRAVLDDDPFDDDQEV